MSLGNCIPDLVAAGKLTAKQGEKAQQAYDRQYKRLIQKMGPVQAAAEASEAALRELEYEAKLRKRQTLLQVATQKDIAAEIAKGDRYRTPLHIIERVDAQRRAVLGRAHAMIEGILSKHSRNLIGEARDKTGLTDLGREVFGEKTGNASAAELASAWTDTVESLRERFNRAGGAIQKLKDWGLPQAHDSLKVRAVPYEEWRGDILKGLAVDRMIDDATGQAFTPDALEEALQAAYDTIRSDGWDKRDAGSLGRGKLANQRADHRFFKFRDFDAWLAYSQQYGTGNVFDSMMGHIEGMARDIALMETLGPNPVATSRWMQDSIAKGAAEGEEAARGIGAKIAGTGGNATRARSAVHQLGQLYDVVSGQLNSPVNEVWARRFGGTRSFLTSALLGSASIVATTDVAYQAVTRAFNGLPVTGMMRSYLKLLNPLSAADRKVAIRLSLIAEEASKMAASLNRYIDGTHGPEVAMRMADATLRVSGLSPWTQAGRWAFGMAFLGHLDDMRDLRWDQILGNKESSPLLEAFKRYGITPEDWEAMRASKALVHKKASFLDPAAIADDRIGDKLLRMVLTETDYAVPTATARSRALTSFGQRPGTIGGELLRNMFLFKNFGVSMLLTHGARIMEQKPWNAAKYSVGLVATTTLLGAMAIQLKEIAKGKDVQDMDPRENPGFWGKAVFTGGGFGIFGDFLGSSTNRFGGGLAETLAGPVVGLAADIGKAVSKPVADAVDPNKQANPGKEAVRLAGRYTPGSSIWYLRAAYERLLLDELSAQIDPDYYDSWDRMERRAADQGQGYWWRPGQDAPERLPTTGTAPASP